MTNPDVSYYRHLGGHWYWEIVISILQRQCPIHRGHLHATVDGDGYCRSCHAWWYWDQANQSVHSTTTPPETTL